MGFRMWDETVIFLDGWFVLIDSKGNNSVVSHNYARKREREYISYQTRMDITHAGFPPEDAYKSRGYSYKDGKWVYLRYRIDDLITGEARTVSERLIIPKNVSDIPINRVADEAFSEERNLKVAVFHRGIKRIGKSAFAGCESLAVVKDLPHNAVIAENAFADTEYARNNKSNS